ncbi:MAG: alkaline phosphatase family protein [Promethearchaeota archaeon]
MRRHPKGVKLIILGLDGATFEVIGNHLERLPTLNSLIREGVSGKLLSTIPMDTAVAWPAFATGRNPGKLGIYDFMIRDPESMKLHVLDFRDLSYDFFWHYIPGSVGLASIPAIPPQNVSAFFIQGSLVILPPDGTFYVMGEKRKLPPYYNHYIKWYEDKGKILKNLEKSVENRCSVYVSLLKETHPDFAMFLFDAIDHIQHHFWAFMDKSHPAYRKTRYEEAIVNTYAQVDECIKEIISRVDEDTHILIVSDHGFGPCHTKINITRWLEKNGYLGYGQAPRQRLFYKILRLLFRIGAKLPDFIKRTLIRRYLTESKTDQIAERETAIDWSISKAYSWGYCSPIFINLQGREPDGIVPPAEYEKLREEIIQKLLKLRDPETSRPVFKTVLKKEDIYSGQFLNLAPDILIIPHRGYGTSTSLASDAPLFERVGIYPGTGIHELEGVFIFKGPTVKQGAVIKGAKIMDIAPTILHLFGVSIPSDMDGRVLREIFKKGSEPYQRSITRQVSKDEATEPHSLLRKDEEEKIIERLRDLGYM